MTFTISIVAPRYKCASMLRETQADKDFGLISDVKFTKVGWFTYHLEFKTEVKSL